jgi:hypothetical protein
MININSLPKPLFWNVSPPIYIFLSLRYSHTHILIDDFVNDGNNGENPNPNITATFPERTASAHPSIRPHYRNSVLATRDIPPSIPLRL